jgi:pyrophosphate--fructose-6-phosphate 1-phosphotransferase
MKIAFLTSGGIAPCLSASIGRLTKNYLTAYPDAEIIGYLNGYKGLLLGHSISFPKSLLGNTDKFYQFGGSPIGNSRVKLTNIDDCIKKGYVKNYYFTHYWRR